MFTILNNRATFRLGEKKKIAHRYTGVRASKLLLVAVILLLCSLHKVQAQGETNYAVHANIIYHFTKYIDWPQDKKSGEFIIGVIDNTVLYDELSKNTAAKMVGSQKIVIKSFSSSASSFNCHILYIGEEASGNIKKIVAKTAGSAVLLVTESEGLAQKGSCINFAVVADHLKLEINKINIEQRNMAVASELLQLGKVVK
jgi:hypothetical protein